MRSRSGLDVYYSGRVLEAGVNLDSRDIPRFQKHWRRAAVCFRVTSGYSPEDQYWESDDPTKSPLGAMMRQVLGEVQDSGATAFVYVCNRRDRAFPEPLPHGVPVPVGDGLVELAAVICPD